MKVKRIVGQLKAKFQDSVGKPHKNLEDSPILGRIIRKSKALVLPGFQGVPLYTVMGYFAKSLGKGVIFQRAAAMTYRVFVALIPMIIALFSVIAFLGTNLQQTLLTMLESFVPSYVWPAVSGMITDVITRQNGTLSSVMLFFGLYFTIICINGLLAAFNNSYFNSMSKPRNLVKQLLLSAEIMVIAFFIILLVVMLFISASLVMNYVHGHFFGSGKGYFLAVHGLKWIFTYAAIYFLISIIYYLAPVNKKNYTFFSAGSSTCTILLVVLLWVLNLYFSNFSNYNVIYGSLGAIFAILLWINWSSLIVLVGFDLNVSIAKAKERKQLQLSLQKPLEAFSAESEESDKINV